MKIMGPADTANTVHLLVKMSSNCQTQMEKLLAFIIFTVETVEKRKKLFNGRSNIQ
jgi:hypothetical protein